MKKWLAKYRKNINPPYSKGDYRVVGFTLLIIFLAYFFVLLTFRSQYAASNFPKTVNQALAAFEVVPDEILIRFKPGAKKTYQDKILKSQGLNLKKEIPKIGVKVLKVSPQARDKVIAALSHHPSIDFVEPNGIVKSTQAPNAPGTLVAEAINSTSVALSWGAAADDGTVSTYYIYKNGQLISLGNILDLTVKNLTPNATYQFYVQARDDTGNMGPNSNTVTVTTLGVDPTPDPSLSGPCALVTPSGSLTPYSQSGSFTDTFAYSVTIKNNDTGACPKSFFYVWGPNSSLLPGWSNPSGTIVSLNPGESTTVAFKETPSPYASGGNYTGKVAIENALDDSKRLILGFETVITSTITPTPSTTTPTSTPQPTLTPFPTIPISGTPNDPYFSQQWGPQKIQAPAAWAFSTSSPNVKIAVLDTGIDLNHQDLFGKVLTSVNYSSSSTTSDVYGHGTHVSGSATAITNNNIGIAGVGGSSPLINVKVLDDSGSGTWDGVASGIVWAADNGANIINMSLGSTSATSAVESAVNYAWGKGVLIAAAAGNNGNTTPFYPAYYANSIAVAATDSNDQLASFSNRGDWVDVAAPGVNILSSLPGNQYASWNGTSMATPHVSGLAALLWTKVIDTNGDGFINDEVRICIQDNADNIGISGIGNGRINAYRAVQCVQPTPPPPDTQNPTATITSPVSGSTVSGGVSVDVAVTDNVGVEHVDLFLDGQVYAMDDSSPYSFFIDTTTLPDGNHSLVAQARDTSGNFGTSSSVNITVGNAPTPIATPIPTATPTSTPTATPTPTPSPTPTATPTPTPDMTAPSVLIIAPANGGTVPRNKAFNIAAAASDNVGVTKVEFRVNNSLLCTDSLAPYSCLWNVPVKPNVSYTLSVKAYDAKGNTGTNTITAKSSK